MATVTRPPRPKQHQLTLAVSIDGTPYTLTPIDCDPSIGDKAFRFEKLVADQTVSDVRLDGFGLQCDCRGWQAHGHCKHCETIMALGRMFDQRPPQVAAPHTAGDHVQLVPCSRCAGRGQVDDGCGCGWCAGQGFELGDRLIPGAPPASQPIPEEDVPF